MEILRNHPCHPQHELEPQIYTQPYKCHGCKQKGFGPGYRCEKCDFDFHQACTYTGTEPIYHDYFPGSKFMFLRDPPEPCHPTCKIRCDACRKYVNGFVFHCEDNDLDLHPCCWNLKRSYQMEDVKFNLNKKVKGNCMWCNRKSLKDGGSDNGWSYVSECKKYHVHVACVTEMALETWYNNNSGGGGGSGSSGGGRQESLALEKKVKKLQAVGRYGDDGFGKNKFWRILKFIIKTIVSIVIGDPTMILASFFINLLP